MGEEASNVNDHEDNQGTNELSIYIKCVLVLEVNQLTNGSLLIKLPVVFLKH